ncbi:MAG: DinB family protein [Candidatus Marsarchaeota archaeon]|nr:DinB family protein [Candidatus Marsarchaeota archaeon]
MDDADNEQMKERVSEIIEHWKYTRKLTYDLVKVVPVDILNKHLDRPIYDSMAKQIYELALMQRHFADILDNKKADFSKMAPKNFKVRENSELIGALKISDEYFFKVISVITDWGSQVYEAMGRKRSAYGVVQMLIEHETHHQGQFAAISYMTGIKLPKSWAGEVSFHFK